MEVKAVNLKSNDMALKNCVYMPVGLAKDPDAIVHIIIKDKYIKAKFSSIIEKPTIGLGKALRQYLQIDLVHPFQITPTEPLNQKDKGIKKITLQLSIRKNEKNIQRFSFQRIKAFLRQQETGTVFNYKQPFFLNVDAVIYQLVPQQIIVGKKPAQYGLLVKNTEIDLIAAPGQVFEQEKAKSEVSRADSEGGIFRPGFNAADMGIGGLDQQLFNIFRRTFASRRMKNQVVERFGVKHVKGILLYGPPGTGKTLIARKLAKALNTKEDNLKIVNGPQIFSKFVGESQENIRKLFQKAREDEKKYGPQSSLHIIVFDQIDAICKQRGIYSGGTNVNDQVVNQLLSNIDGVEALNNIVVIGMTNRKDLLDEAILRPGRFQVHIEVSLPDLKGRQQILSIHTAKLRQNGLFQKDCKLQQLARLTRNYTGAQIEALIKCASSFTITRCTNIMNFSQKLKIDEKNLKLSMEDFLKALEEVKPQFGIDEQKFSSYFRQKIINYGSNFDRLMNSLAEVIQITDSNYGKVKSVLLYGPSGSGKTALAVNFAKHCTFPYIKIIAPELLVGQDSAAKIHFMQKIFEDAYKTTRACIIIDNIERLVEYTAIGRRFSNQVLQSLLVLISKVPPNSQTNLMIIGTTSMVRHMQQLDIPDGFHNKLYVPYLEQEQVNSFLMQKIKIDDKMAQKIANILISMCSSQKSTKQKKGISIRGLIEIIGLVSNYNDIDDWKECYSLIEGADEDNDQS